jgi:hypothetical protein
MNIDEIISTKCPRCGAITMGYSYIGNGYNPDSYGIFREYGIFRKGIIHPRYYVERSCMKMSKNSLGRSFPDGCGTIRFYLTKEQVKEIRRLSKIEDKPIEVPEQGDKK